ncbi:MAG: UDP-N-acetylglucosamine 2-epimerase (non-hydrolyzing) [Eubacteriales bacterium]|nr:UDP-N-acetylglucosamine 2-epimerase (non-hydrolyzing) [Eubacteriales bacterium]
MQKIKVMTIFGTRPEAVKMAPLIKELKSHEEFETAVCVTAQHRDMLDQVLAQFEIVPDHDLNIMKPRQELLEITTSALIGLSDIFKKSAPDIVLVHGDTTTTFVASLAAFYNKISIGHVEAGLRTFIKYFPYPEEINRKLTGCLADIHFAPTALNRDNLIKEGIKSEDIYVTGNTVIDSIKSTVDKNYRFENAAMAAVDFSKRIIAVTAHRRENFGEPLENICRALGRIAERYEDVEIVYAVHRNPLVSETAHRILDGHTRVLLVEPLGPRDMHNFLDRCYLVLTDSGGLQEEAPALGKPMLVMRNETERPEAVAAGTVKIVGTDENVIFQKACALLDNNVLYSSMANAVNPYGDGMASERIALALLYKYGFRPDPPKQFLSGLE